MVTVNKKGFTLTEILVVIALIGVLLMFVMPNLIGIFTSSVKSTMKIQEQEIEDGALLYLEDYCRNKLPGKMCPSSISRNSDKTYSGQISLGTLVSEGYVDDVAIQGVDCKGCVIYNNSKPQAYLICGDVYSTNDNVGSVCNLN